jgi:hypothetical protein
MRMMRMMAYAQLEEEEEELSQEEEDELGHDELELLSQSQSLLEDELEQPHDELELMQQPVPLRLRWTISAPSTKIATNMINMKNINPYQVPSEIIECTECIVCFVWSAVVDLRP